MRIQLPAETWAEILAWLNRREFAQKMEQLWDREFSPIAEKWLHEWSKVKINLLEYRKNTDTEKAELWQYRRGNYRSRRLVPFPEVDMPKNICGFEGIQISYVDTTVLAFLRRIQTLLHNKVHFTLASKNYYEKWMMKIALDHLLPMFNGGGNGEFESVAIYNDYAVPFLNDNSRYSSALLNTKLLKINNGNNTGMFSFGRYHELLADWLFTKRTDGQPRMLVLSYLDCHQGFVGIIQKRFNAATTEASPFIIRFDQRFNSSFVDRTIKNDKNGQQLIMREVINSWNGESYVLFISCPMGMNPELMAEWEQKVLVANSPSFEQTFQLMFPTFGPSIVQRKQKLTRWNREEGSRLQRCDE